MNDIIIMEGLIKRLRDKNVMNKIRKRVENDPEIGTKATWGKWDNIEVMLKYFDKYITLCYPNEVEYNRSILLKGFNDHFLSICKYIDIDVNQINPENKDFCALMKKEQNIDIHKLSYKGQVIYYMYYAELDDNFFIFTDDKGNFVAKSANDMMKDFISFYQNNPDEYNKRYK